MYKFRKISYGSGIRNVVNVNVLYNLRVSSLTIVLLLTSFLVKPSVAADHVEKNVPLEKQPTLLNADEKPENSLASQKSNQIIGDGFTIKTKPEKVHNSSSSLDNLTKDTVIQQLSAAQTDSSLQPQTIQEAKNPKVIAQIDSSTPAGDTFGDIEQIRQELLIDPILIAPGSLIGEPPKASPGSTAGTPSGYGAGSGQAYIGVGLFFPLEEGNVDASLSTGFGLGNPFKFVGLEVNINFTSAGGTLAGGGSFDVGDSGYLGFKLHKSFRDGTAVAVGWSNPVKWGESSDNEDTFYGVITRAFPLQPQNPNHKLPLTISLGVGTGSFRSTGAIEADENTANFFGSLGLRVIPQASLVSSWTGRSINVGSSIAPFRSLPLVINALLTDVAGNTDNGLGFSLSGGYSFQF